MGVKNSESSIPIQRDNDSQQSLLVPHYYNNILYGCKTAAITAAFLNLIGKKYAYRKHRFVLQINTLNPESELMDFWLPAINTFLFVYNDMPIIGQCKLHEEVAKLGHNVAVLVGQVASPIRLLSTDVKNGWKGWLLEEFTGEMVPGWLSWMVKDDKIELAVSNCPYDARCCDPQLLRMYDLAKSTVDADDTSDDEMEPSFP